jgi:hypothetical protein
VEKAKAQELHSQAEQAGEEPPLSVHPDDIQLYADGSVEIVGPTHPDAIRAMRDLHRRVDFHVVNIAYAKWVEKRWIRTHGRPTDGCLYAELSFLDEQAELPSRLRMPDEEVEARLRRYSRYSGRVLHGFLRAKAYELGLGVPPREARTPLILTSAVLDYAKTNKISLKQLLPAWLSAQEKLVQQQLDELMAVAQSKSASNG